MDSNCQSWVVILIALVPIHTLSTVNVQRARAHLNEFRIEDVPVHASFKLTCYTTDTTVIPFLQVHATWTRSSSNSSQ